MGTAERRVNRQHRPATAIVSFDGHLHRVDVGAIELAYFRKVVEGRFDGREALAGAAKLSRSTVSRFLAGRGCSIRVALRILAELDLRFDDVAKPLGTRSDDTI